MVLTKPKNILVKEVLVGKKHRNWNYARVWNFLTNTIYLEPCCLKSKPCWECKKC